MGDKAVQGTGFIRAHGRQLLDGDGKPLLLRGVGLGNWLLPEGYMWKFSGDRGDRPRRIAQRICELIGEEKAAEFWDTFYERYVTEADVRRMAEEGYNSVRLPINAPFILEEAADGDYIESHLRLIDQFVEWCRTYSLYVVLDLHGAPGGQTGANIDDSLNDHPDLFTDPEQRKLTVDLWVMLAKRYKDDPIIAGYDLLNEPLPDHFSQYWDRLVPLYRELIAAIRQVDPHHMIIIEGAHWATNFSMITEPLDDNMLLQFHKYWNAPDTESIQRYIDKGAELNVPLYMGEGGENNAEWYAGAFQLFEDHGISWNFWPWKKLNTLNSPCSIRAPKDWDKIQAYIAGGEHPGVEAAEAILWEYLDGIRIENCEYRQDVVNSMLRRAPLRIIAPYYGYKGAGVDHAAAQQHGSSDIPLRSADGVGFSFAYPSEDNFVDFANHGGAARPPHTIMCAQLAVNEWLRYEFNVAEARAYKLVVCAAAVGDAEHAADALEVTLGDHEVSVTIDSVEWSDIVAMEATALPIGKHHVTLRVLSGDIKLQWVELG
ncbi:cellulase family glycosylhydrolase [Paenibacillus sp. GP183]|uniref:cellulase family glycosylhydrolase n=1 Tax=Paenibacillus sp. GP183 TaxID=1882751 RepID=UPI000898671B|nr:cellulase family glycosylhydrolase [Paenibacillus sp. GP183]SEC01744.1 Cellulase (glycosyl hydrolase family 5) [Paenibacillus sp. GP183]